MNLAVYHMALKVILTILGILGMLRGLPKTTNVRFSPNEVSGKIVYNFGGNIVIIYYNDATNMTTPLEEDPLD